MSKDAGEDPQPFRPISARGKEDPRFDGLEAGVPDWMRLPLQSWITPLFYKAGSSSGIFHQERHERAQLLLRRAIPVPHRVNARMTAQAFAEEITLQPELCIDLLDCLLQHERLLAMQIQALESILRDGGSAWTVKQDSTSPYLARRVHTVIVERAVKASEGAPANAVHHLESAWRQIYGRVPNPNAGYHEAVKAVEVTVCPVVEPKSSRATLGTAIAVMRNAPDGKFVVAITGPPKPLDNVRVLCEFLWQGHARHGQSGEDAKRDHTQEEAEMALHAALTLVHWFSRGFVKMAP